MSNAHGDLWWSERATEDVARNATIAAELRVKLVGWVAVANIGSIGLTGAFIAQLPDPDHALQSLIWSAWAFLIGGVLAGAACYLLLLRSNARAKRLRIIAAKRAASASAKSAGKTAKPNPERDKKLVSLQKQSERLHGAGDLVLATSAACLFFGLAAPLVHATLGHNIFGQRSPPSVRVEATRTSTNGVVIHVE